MDSETEFDDDPESEIDAECLESLGFAKYADATGIIYDFTKSGTTISVKLDRNRKRGLDRWSIYSGKGDVVIYGPQTRDDLERLLFIVLRAGPRD